MSIEKKLEDLTAAVIALTEVMSKSLAQAPVAEVEKVAKSKPKKQEALIEKEASSDEIPFDAVTREDLQAICSDIVRSDRSKKDAIREALGEYDAKTLSQVPDEKLAELKLKLEAIKND